MSEYEMSKTVAAPAGVVFAEAGDLDHSERWMDPSFRFQTEEPPAVTVVEPREHRGEHATVRVSKEQMRIEWGSAGSGRYTGWLQVEGSGDGPSQVIIHLSFFEPGEAPPRARVEEALRHSLDRLGERVERSG
jgi:hypothetical protein